MPTSAQEPWSEVERAMVAVGTLADAAGRYCIVRGGDGPELLEKALAIGARARALNRRGVSREHTEVINIAHELDTIAARYRVLLDNVFLSPEYRALTAAYAGADHAELERLIPAVFGDVERADGVRYAYHGVSPRTSRNRTLEADVLAARLVGLCSDGLEAAEPGAPGTDDRLRAVTLQSDWRQVDTPVALRLEVGTISTPVFRLGTELLIYRERLTTAELTKPPVTVIARTAAPDRWPETGVDYDVFRVALTAALKARRHSHVLLDE